jgi:hypothetical protein
MTVGDGVRAGVAGGVRRAVGRGEAVGEPGGAGVRKGAFVPTASGVGAGLANISPSRAQDETIHARKAIKMRVHIFRMTTIFHRQHEPNMNPYPPAQPSSTSSNHPTANRVLK